MQLSHNDFDCHTHKVSCNSKFESNWQDWIYKESRRRYTPSIQSTASGVYPLTILTDLQSSIASLISSSSSAQQPCAICLPSSLLRLCPQNGSFGRQQTRKSGNCKAKKCHRNKYHMHWPWMARLSRWTSAACPVAMLGYHILHQMKIQLLRDTKMALIVMQTAGQNIVLEWTAWVG